MLYIRAANLLKVLQTCRYSRKKSIHLRKPSSCLNVLNTVLIKVHFESLHFITKLKSPYKNSLT